MKKNLILLFVAAICMVASVQTASAAQQNLKSLIEKEHLMNALQVSAEKPMTLKALPERIPQANITPVIKKTPGTTPAAVAAHATDLDTVEVNFRSLYNDPFYTPVTKEVNRQGDTILTGGDWYFIMRNDRYQFIFDLYAGTPESPAGTYTEKDLDEWFSWCMFPEADGNTHYYKTCDLTIQHEKLSDNLVKYTLDAVMLVTCGIGGEEYGYFKVHAEHKMVLPTEKWDVAILDCKVTSAENYVRIAGKNDTIEADLTFYTELGIEGYYTHKLMDSENSKIVHRGKTHEIMNLEGVLLSSPNDAGGVSYVFMFEALTADTTFYNVAMEAPIVPTDTVKFTCSNMQMDGSDGSTQSTITIAASNMEYSVLAGYNDTKVIIPSTYSGDNAMVYLTELATDNTITSLLCTIQLSDDGKGGCKVHVEMLGSDHKYYVMDLSWDIPTPTKTVTLDFPTTAKSKYYIDDLGLKELQLAHYDGEYSVSFDILNIDRVLGGSFTQAHLWMEQTFIVHHVGDTEKYVPMADILGTVEQEDGVTYLDATVIGFDSVKYVISMFYEVPTPTDTVTYVFDATQNSEEVAFINALPQGIFILEGMSSDGNLMANVQVSRLETQSIEGTFSNDGIFDHNDFYIDNTFVSVYNVDDDEYDEYYLQKGEMTVTIDENKIIHAVAEFICDDAKLYKLTFKVPYERAHLPFDSEDGAINYTYESESFAAVTDWIDGYGLIGLELIPEDFSNVSSFYFVADTLDWAIGIPVGVYPINNSFEVGTVVASKGIGMDYLPIESYYCGLTMEEDENGEMAVYYNYDELYCLVDGTVTVEKLDRKTLRLTVEAVNSYDRPVKLSYTGPVDTAVDHVEAEDTVDTKKLLINGQLYIIRNGVTYTIVGTRL